MLQEVVPGENCLYIGCLHSTVMGGADFKATLTVDLQFLPETIHRLCV